MWTDPVTSQVVEQAADDMAGESGVVVTLHGRFMRG